MQSRVSVGISKTQLNVGLISSTQGIAQVKLLVIKTTQCSI
jgi:hypothetical protein